MMNQIFIYMGNGCLTKHPFKTGCLEFQACMGRFTEIIFTLFIHRASGYVNYEIQKICSTKVLSKGLNSK